MNPPFRPFGNGPLSEHTASQINSIGNWPRSGMSSNKFQNNLRMDSPLVNPNVTRTNFLNMNVIEDNENLDSYILKDTLLAMELTLDKGLNFAIPLEDNTESDFQPSFISTPKFKPPPGSKFFVIKSYNEADIISAFKNSCWSSTNLGNKRLDRVFRSNNGQNVFLFFSVNGSGHFCAVAEMTGTVDFDKDANCWSDPKWKGSFPIRFLFVKDIPNRCFKMLSVFMVKNGVRSFSSVITSRDTQELPYDVGETMVKIFDEMPENTSFLSSL